MGDRRWGRRGSRDVALRPRLRPRWPPWPAWPSRFRAARAAITDPWAWLEPYPVPANEGAPRSLSIAFVAALQRLPPDQRAALVLSDVLDFGIADVAEILDCDTAEAGGLLLRARSAMPAEAGPPGPGAGPDNGDDVDEGDVVARFTCAFDRGDVAALTALLTRDAWLRMRPLPAAYRGKSAARHFLTVHAFPGGTTSYRLVATRANGQPAFGCYLRDAVTSVDHACGLLVLTVEDGGITAIDRFVDNSLLHRFGLPRSLPGQR
jgi:hypothetical protein